MAANRETDGRTPFRRHPATRFVLSLVTVVGIAAFSVYLLGGPTAPRVLTGVIAGALVVGGFHAFRAMAGHIGRLTATAALSLLGATVLGAYAALAPQCPDRMDLARCGTPEIASWTLVGAGLPVTYLIALGLPLLGAGVAGRAVRHAWGRR